jgi:cytochrome P450 / NADPH-cytochrome P450 reductase
MQQVLREALRLDTPIPVFSVSPVEDTIIGGKYQVRKGDDILIIPSGLHQDPEVYDEPLIFKPERMLEENFTKLPKHAWKPFGNGTRAVSLARPT